MEHGGSRGSRLGRPGAGADLAAFVEQAVVVGALAIASAGNAQDTFNLEQLVQDVGTRTTASTTEAVEITASMVAETAVKLHEASEATRKAIAEASEVARKSFGESITSAKEELRGQVTQLLGGKDPELLARLKPVLDEFGARLGRRADEQSGALLDRAMRALDADDPTSPMARHLKQLDRRNDELTKRWDSQHADLAKSVAELTTAIQVQGAAAAASRTIASVSPLKGASYEDAVHEIVTGLAVGLGDEYAQTGRLVGAVARSKKGDGVLTVAGGPARVVLEMSDSARSDWNDYLDEAERNRQASASVGLVPSIEQNAGEALRVLGPRRVVMVFDQDGGDVALLRTVVQLLRTAAVTATTRQDDADVRTATERLGEALEVLPKVDGIRKRAGIIRGHADHIDRDADALQTTLNRLLLQARTALEGASLSAVDAQVEDSSGVA